MQRFAPVLLGLSLLFTDNAIAAPRTVILDVRNMVCPACPYSVKKSLEKVAGVNKVTVRFDTRDAIVVYDDAKTTAEALTEATAKAGFPSTVRDGASR